MDAMNGFRRMTLFERIHYRFSSSYRLEVDTRRREAIRELCANPLLPCTIDGVLVGDGMGLSQEQRDILGQMMGDAL